jgi:predicted RNase H-like HicB family nuclease
MDSGEMGGIKTLDRSSGKEKSGKSQEGEDAHTFILRAYWGFAQYRKGQFAERVLVWKWMAGNMKYIVILERESDGGFVASVPVLPGCISQGNTREEAMANIKEAVDLYLEDCIAVGDPIPVEDSREYVLLEPALGR